MSNSELLQTLASMFGLAIYVDSVGRSMEFSFIKDIQDAQCLNLTSYYLSSETAINEKESKQYKSSLTPLSSSDFSDESLIDEVQHKEQLPDAEDHIGSAALVRDQNRYFVAEMEGDAYTNWKYVWKENGTNKEVLKVGDEDANSTEDITPAAKIPSMGILKHCEPTVPFVCECSNSVDQTLIFSQCIRFPVIQGGCISFLNSSQNSTLDLILMRYIGQYAIPYRFEFDFGENGKMTTAYVSAFSNGVRYYELMSPVCYGDDGERLPGNDLAATGEHSIGEVYVKPWLQLLGNYEKITYRFLLPPAKLLEVIRLFRPQDAAPETQVRWIFVENVRVLPIRMTFEIVEGKDQILTEIECAKPVV